jgi:hypothetical protein
MAVAGYQHLIDRFSLNCIAPAVPAQVQPVTKIVRTDDSFLVPFHVAPEAAATPLEHLLFAIRYEGIDMAVVDALAHQGVITDAQVREVALATPNGGFVRRLAHVWETVTGRDIEGVNPGGPFVPLHDPQLYLVGAQPARNAKWRVDCNGLGNAGYCPTVRRTTAILELLQRDLVGEVQAFAADAAQRGMLDRILSWAYLDETRSSYEIEHEDASTDKAGAFVAALREAHLAREVSEDYLVQLQNAVITNPLGRESGYRNQQNWLARGGHGAIAVRYVPPEPGGLEGLMEAFCAMANVQAPDLPLVRAALSSFGFVYLHPFMDGNGRLSRFLFHHNLCRTGSLPDGAVLPVSTALKENERDYLLALEAFSRPARELWDVRWIDGTSYVFQPRCRESVYRYWDATPQVEFSIRMAARAVDVHLVGEAQFLSGFDLALADLTRRIDLPGPVLHELILRCREQGGVISKNRRKQFSDSVPAEYFDQIEKTVRKSFAL